MRTKMKLLRLVMTLMLYLICFVGLIFSIAYLYHNLEQIPIGLQKANQMSGIGKAVDSGGGQPGDLPAVQSEPASEEEILHKSNLITRGRNFLRMISMDYSAITPFLLSWFFGSVLLSSWRYKITWKRKKKVENRLVALGHALPFPRRYQTIWIQMGFIGTLWGFMLIGWRLRNMGSAQTVETLDILLKAFGTALLSTFTAVVLVYILAPVFRAIWLWALGVNWEGGTGINLKEKVQDLSAALKQVTQSTTLLNLQLASMKNELSQFSADKIAATLKDHVVDPLVEATEQMKVGIAESLQRSFEELGKKVDVTNTSIDELKTETTEAHSTVKLVVEGTQKIETTITNFKKQEKSARKKQVQHEKNLVSAVGKIPISYNEAVKDLHTTLKEILTAQSGHRHADIINRIEKMEKRTETRLKKIEQASSRGGQASTGSWFARLFNRSRIDEELEG